MTSVEICHGTWVPEFAPLLFGAVFLLVIGLASMRPRDPAEPRFPRAVFLVLGFAVCFGAGVSWRSATANSFIGFDAAPDKLSLEYFFPTTVALSGAGIDSLSLVREKSWSSRGAEGSRWSLRIRTPTRTYDSCKTGILDEIGASARLISTNVKKPLMWEHRCTNGRVLPSTETSVFAPGNTPSMPACSDPPK